MTWPKLTYRSRSRSRWSPEFIPYLPLESGIYSVFAVGVRNLFRICRWSPEFIPYLPLESGIYSVPWPRRNKFRTPTAFLPSIQSP
jgi:hypothetical protein